MLKGYGDLLKKARESRNLKFQDLHKEMKVDPVYLKALEEEDATAFEKPVYMRLFLRTYARFLKLEEAQIISLFDQTPEGQQTEKEINRIGKETIKGDFAKSVLKDANHDHEKQFHEKQAETPVLKAGGMELTLNNKKNLIIVIAAAALLILAIILFAVLGGKKSEGNKSVYPVPGQTETLNVLAKGKADTWIKVRHDNGEEDFLLKKGSDKRWKDITKIVFLVGNAAGVEFTVNGESIGAIGEEGEVINGLIFQSGKNWYIDKGQGFTQGARKPTEVPTAVPTEVIEQEPAAAETPAEQ
ncbi:MAG: hypothetical protein CVV21_05295 [Candidatus Goldiibacteriota bacterium HGW-Goldbacteria-1]|jgi:hypothetical protein|nr:MAG: hypothetical protein CVV21_05295 [Candidatus Goldiibacteriota bacterium HGW-Goldbacteria-1]